MTQQTATNAIVGIAKVLIPLVHKHAYDIVSQGGEFPSPEAAEQAVLGDTQLIAGLAQGLVEMSQEPIQPPAPTVDVTRPDPKKFPPVKRL